MKEVSTKQKSNWTPVQKTSSDTLNRHYFGIEEGNRYLKRFKLLLRSGVVHSIPYSLLPIISLTVNADLIIATNTLEITIKGRNLRILEEALSEEQVVWIKESETEFDDEETEVFVSEISIISELI